MKKIFITTTILLFTGVFGVVFSQELVENKEGADFGLVYFLRGKGHIGSATAFSAFIDEDRVCNLSNRRFSAHAVEPGEHEFRVQFDGGKTKKKAEVLKIDIEAGKTYYIQMTIQTGVFVNDLTPVEITRNTALRLVEDDKIEVDKDCIEAAKAAWDAVKE